MQELTRRRRARHAAINWLAYRRQRDYLADIFPQAITPNGSPTKRPLTVGIREDLIGANTALTPAEIDHFLSAYTFGPKYLHAVRAGGVRYGLDGVAVGAVDKRQADYADKLLAAHLLVRHDAKMARAA